MKKRIPIARQAARRRAVFESPDAAFTHWQGRGAFKAMSDDILRDYVEGGLIERADDQWELACAPIWEQAIFVAQWHNLFKAAQDLPDNSHIIYAGHGFALSSKRTRAAVQAAQPKIEVSFDQTLRHLFPLYQPDLARDMLRHVLNSR